MRIVITGHQGFLGAALLERLWGDPTHPIVQGVSRGMDLLDIAEVANFLEDTHPDVVVHCAMPPSDGITTMATEPARFMHECLQLDTAVLRACALAKVPRVVAMGSVCAFPAVTPEPTREESLWDGYPDPVNGPYGIAKRTQLALLLAYTTERKFRGEHIILSNLYGPGDTSGHVVPSLIRRALAVQHVADPLVVWGQPSVSRSLLYVADAAEGIARIVLTDPLSHPVVTLAAPGTTTMHALAVAICLELGIDPARITFDGRQPTGHVSRRFALTRLKQALQWEPSTTLEEGLALTVAWVRGEGVGRGDS